ncbi:hypothetical protein [Robiginitalea sp.]|uniref:hypothetical protein n=1 Tax=Robiginitalea sp. TaxID=1902411 RepID=UPI003C4B7AA9
MAIKSSLQIFGSAVAIILGFAYLTGFGFAVLNYSEISQELGSSSRIGIVGALVFQMWFWITAFVLLYIGFRKLTGLSTTKENEPTDEDS